MRSAPADSGQTRTVSGRINANGTINQTTGPVQVSKPATGDFTLRFPGASQVMGMASVAATGTVFSHHMAISGNTIRVLTLNTSAAVVDSEFDFVATVRP